MDRTTLVIQNFYLSGRSSSFPLYQTQHKLLYFLLLGTVK